MADTDWNLHSKQLITPVDDSRMLLEPSDETAKAVEVGGFRTWLMNTALFNTLTTTAKNIIGAIEEVKGIADNNNTQLNDFANERGYLNTKVVSESDWKQLKTNGRYKVVNAIDIDNSTENTFLIDVISMNDSYAFQYAYCLFSNTGNTGKSYINILDNNNWGQYKEIVTTETKDLTLLNGWARDTGSLKAIKIDKKVFIDMSITGGTGSGTAICDLPFHNVNDGQMWNITVQNESWEMINVSISIVNNQLLYWSDINKRVPIHISYETI